MAVLAKSESLVRTLIARGTGFSERTSNGETPLHLCADWAQGIRLLLAAGFDVTACNDEGFGPIDYALSLEGSDSVSLLLEAGCSLGWGGHLHGSFSLLGEAMKHFHLKRQPGHLQPCVRSLIENVKQRRERVEAFAREHLRQNKLEELRYLGTAIDDGRSHSTWTAILEAGFEPPSGLDTTSVFVYHTVRSKDQAEYLWLKGFRNVSAYNDLGLTPLMACSIGYDPSPEVGDWLLQHGADPLQLHRDHDWNALHLATKHLRMSFKNGSERLTHYIASSTVPLLLSNIPITSHDSCRCSCSIAGCTPTTMLFKRTLSEFMPHDVNHSKGRFVYQVSDLLYWWYKTVAVLGLAFSDARKEIYRLSLFDNHELTHTCCRIFMRFGGGVVQLMPEADVHEIQEEEEELIEQFEEAMEEYDRSGVEQWGKRGYLGEVEVGKRPSRRWANTWAMRSFHEIDEEACDQLREDTGFTDDRFWRPSGEGWTMEDERQRQNERQRQREAAIATQLQSVRYKSSPKIW